MGCRFAPVVSDGFVHQVHELGGETLRESDESRSGSPGAFGWEAKSGSELRLVTKELSADPGTAGGLLSVTLLPGGSLRSS
jgi:hypothetical protein